MNELIQTAGAEDLTETIAADDDLEALIQARALVEDREAYLAAFEPVAPADVPWPKLEPGDRVLIRGAPFELVRLNASSIVLRPLVKPGYKASDAIRRMR